MRIRIPFFWWNRQATAPARLTETGTDGYLRCDSAFIPVDTADMWRAARHQAA